MKSSETSQHLLSATAYHESGHAVIGWRCRNWIRTGGIIIDVANPGSGETSHHPLVLPNQADEARRRGEVAWSDFVKRAEREIVTLLAGPVAEMRYRQLPAPPEKLLGYRPEHTGNPRSDLVQVNALLACINEIGREAYQLKLQHRTREMLKERRTWNALREVAELLTAVGRVTADEAESIFRRFQVPQMSELIIVHDIGNSPIEVKR